jgi:hypothetical protein
MFGVGFTHIVALCLDLQPTTPCPTPYVDPISPKDTQPDPMPGGPDTRAFAWGEKLRESAEGHKPLLGASG